MGIANIGLVKANHRRFREGLRDAVHQELNSAGIYGLHWVDNHPHFKPQTGALQKATKFKLAMGMRGGKVSWTNALPYANAIDHGARHHTITARVAPFLHFFWVKAGHWVRTKSVNHPGNKPYSFLWDAWQRSSDRFLERMRVRMAALASRF